MRPQRLEQQTLLGQVDVRRQLGNVRAAVHIVRVFLERALEQRVDRRDRFQPFQRCAQRIVAVRRQQPLQRLGLLQTGLAERIERLPRQIRTPDLQNRQRNAAAEQRAPDVPDVAPDAFVGQVDFFQRAFQPGRAGQRLFQQLDQAVVAAGGLALGEREMVEDVEKQVGLEPGAVVRAPDRGGGDVQHRQPHGSIASLCAP